MINSSLSLADATEAGKICKKWNSEDYRPGETHQVVTLSKVSCTSFNIAMF